jgi:glycosyltransferase involved in cell wall biosynthesis
LSSPVRLVVVLPELRRDSPTHYAHYFALLDELAKLAVVVVVVERGPAPAIDGIEVVAQRRTSPPMRAVELAGLCLRLRRRGFRIAYGAYSAYFGVVFGLVARLVGIRTAFWHCRSDFFDRTIDQQFGLRRMLRDTVPLVLSLHLARALVTGTPGLAKRYAETFRLSQSKVCVVPNEIDLSSWREGDPVREREGNTVLFVHRLSQHKGTRVLPSIFSQVTRRIPNAELVIAGDGPDADWLQTEMAHEIAVKRVRMLGYVSNSEIRALMRSADVLLMPSFEEGFPRVLLEAMASRLPFVATNVGGVLEIVPRLAHELVASPGDSGALAKRVIRVLEDENLRNELARVGAKWVERYDVSVVARTLVEALAGPPSRTSCPES